MARHVWPSPGGNLNFRRQPPLLRTPDHDPACVGEIPPNPVLRSDSTTGPLLVTKLTDGEIVTVLLEGVPAQLVDGGGGSRAPRFAFRPQGTSLQWSDGRG